MDINKAIYRGVKVGFILMLVLLIVYGTMQACAVAYDFGYQYAIESLIDKPIDNEGTGE